MDDAKITPVDIKHKEFRSGMFGFDKDEVTQYLDAVSEEMENRIKIEENLREEIENLKTVEPVKTEEPARKDPSLVEKESLISQTLMHAEKIKQQILNEAHAQKRKLISEAKEESENILEEAHHHLSHLENQYLDIKEEKKEFLLKFRSELQDLMGKINNDSVLNAENEEKMDSEFQSLKEKEEMIREKTLSE